MMQKLMMFKVSKNLFAIKREFVKQRYQKEELFSERARKAKRVKVKLDGADIPLYELSAVFGDNAQDTDRTDGEAMLIKDDEGHMVLLVDTIEDEIDVEKDRINDLSPVFGERSCRYFPKVTVQDNMPVLILSPKGIRAYAEADESGSPDRT